MTDLVYWAIWGRRGRVHLSPISPDPSDPLTLCRIENNPPKGGLENYTKNPMSLKEFRRRRHPLRPCQNCLSLADRASSGGTVEKRERRMRLPPMERIPSGPPRFKGHGKAAEWGPETLNRYHCTWCVAPLAEVKREGRCLSEDEGDQELCVWAKMLRKEEG